MLEELSGMQIDMHDRHKQYVRKELMITTGVVQVLLILIPFAEWSLNEFVMIIVIVCSVLFMSVKINK